MNEPSKSRARSLLRDRRFTSILALVVISLLSAFVAVLVVDNFLVLKSADNFAQDLEIAKETPPTASDDRIRVVTIDESTLREFPYRSPIDRGFLAGLIARIDSAHPRAIGIDVLFDQPTVAEKDAALKQELRAARAPLVIAYTENPVDVTPTQIDFLRSFVPDAMRATPDEPTDQYGTVRFVHPGMKEASGRYLFSFERALAATAGVGSPSHPVPIVWGIPARDDNGVAPKNNYYEISAQQVMKQPNYALVGPAWFANKIVLVGSDVSLVDLHRTPLTAVSSAGNMPGVIIHAYGLSTLLDGARSPYATWRINFFIAVALALVGAILGILNFHLLPRVIALVVILAAYWAACIYLYNAGSLLFGLLAPGLATIASFSAMDSLTGRDARKQRQFIQGAFSRYVSPKVVEALIEDPSRMSLEGERREMSYLFTDIADFTTMSEKIDSKDLARILNAYFEGVTAVVLHHDGMLDKFIGDAVFAIFNAPVDLPNHADHAVRCALEIDEFSEKFRKAQNAAGIDMGITRIGVHTGAAVIGNFGSTSRFNYTAHGDAVNTAARLEGLNKEFGTHICVSGATKIHCDGIDFRPIGSVVLKGKVQAVDVWEPLHPGAMSPDQLERYREAFSRLHEPSGEALELLEGLAAELPNDPCVRHHVRHLRKGLRGMDLVMTEK
ncbi:MAG: adenylate/guanylate cyclase domain-containing protein [Rhizomicrobium sp.]|jgi:class 3 adenylate cyclase